MSQYVKRSTIRSTVAAYRTRLVAIGASLAAVPTTLSPRKASVHLRAMVTAAGSLGASSLPTVPRSLEHGRVATTLAAVDAAIVDAET